MMKKTGSIFAVLFTVTLALALAGSELYGQPEEAAPGLRRMRRREAMVRNMVRNNPEVMAQADANKNGRIDAEERKAFREGMQQKGRQRMDQWLEDNPEMKAKADENGNGTIDDEERNAARSMFRSASKASLMEVIENNPVLKERVDANRDGAIDDQEFRQGRRMVRQAARQTRGRPAPPPAG